MTPAIEAPPLAHFCATVAEQQAVAIERARAAQFAIDRIVELARVIYEATDDMPIDCHRDRARVCAEVIDESGDALRLDFEAIEGACSVIAAALHGRPTDA